MTEYDAMNKICRMIADGKDGSEGVRQVSLVCGDERAADYNTICVRFGDEVWMLRIERDLAAEKEIAEGIYPDYD